MQKRGALSREGIGSAAEALGFPLSDLNKAMTEMGADTNGEVNFPKFLMWWNTCTHSNELYKTMTQGARFEKGVHGGVSSDFKGDGATA